jgi:hypothetical protein
MGREAACKRATTLDHRTQAEEGFACRLHASGQAGGVLNGHMDVAEVALQPILAIDGVGPGRGEDEVSRRRSWSALCVGK